MLSSFAVCPFLNTCIQSIQNYKYSMLDIDIHSAFATLPYTFRLQPWQGMVQGKVVMECGNTILFWFIVCRNHDRI